MGEREDAKLRAGVLVTIAPWLLMAMSGWLAYEFRDFKGEVRELKDAVVKLQVINSSYSTKIEAHENRLSHLETKLDGHIQDDVEYRIRMRR